MIDEKTGGPAFPSTAPFATTTNDISHSMGYNPHPFSMGEAFQQPSISYAGMTLRDWFAGKALPQCIARSSADLARYEGGIPDYSKLPARSAAMAYEIADAMLAERAKVQS